MHRPARLSLLAAFLLSCASPSVLPTPEPVRIEPAPEPVQGTGCPGGASFLDLDPATKSWIVQANLTACATAANQASAVACVQSAIDGAIGSYCVGAGCCLDPAKWVARLDHGRSQVSIAGSVKQYFEIEIHRRVGDERDTVWTVVGRSGYASEEAMRVGEIAAAGVMPDVTDCYAGGGDADLCARSSLGLSNYFATAVGPWPMAFYARGDSRNLLR